jgi:hypothetical protein
MKHGINDNITAKENELSRHIQQLKYIYIKSPQWMNPKGGDLLTIMKFLH